MGDLFSAWTVIAGVVFLAITVWALGAGRKREFDEAARMPLEDDETDQIETGVR